MSTLLFGPPPDDAFEALPSAAEIAFFRANGFLTVERLVSDAELEWLRRIFEFVFSPEQAKARGAPVDRSGTRASPRPTERDGDGDGDGDSSKKRALASLLAQAFFPELRFPELLRSNLHRNARRYAAALLAVPETALSSWGHAIRKPPGGRATNWHQDLAYWEPELDYHALGVWLPMHDVSTEMGAMQFIPGSHLRGLVSHAHDDAPEHNLLDASAGIDTTTAVACPLRAGGATFHHCQTLHYTAPNSTTQPRLAYPIEYQIRPVRRATPRSMPWVDAHRAARGTPELMLMADGEVSRL